MDVEYAWAEEPSTSSSVCFSQAKKFEYSYIRRPNAEFVYCVGPSSNVPRHYRRTHCDLGMIPPQCGLKRKWASFNTGINDDLDGEEVVKRVDRAALGKHITKLSTPITYSRRTSCYNGSNIDESAVRGEYSDENFMYVQGMCDEVEFSYHGADANKVYHDDFVRRSGNVAAHTATYVSTPTASNSCRVCFVNFVSLGLVDRCSVCWKESCTSCVSRCDVCSNICCKMCLTGSYDTYLDRSTCPKCNIYQQPSPVGVAVSMDTSMYS